VETALSERTLRLESIAWSRHQLALRYSLDGMHFSTAYWYPEVDLLGLDARYGRDFMERLHVHAALFDMNKLVSLRPRRLDLGPYARHHTRALERLWRHVFEKVWAQWRYENNLPEEQGPTWVSQPVADSAVPQPRQVRAEEVLLFCGGGKDSLVSMRLLERAGIPHAAFAYASSTYGSVGQQFELVNTLLDTGRARRRHRMVVLEDFMESPVLELHGAEAGVKTVTAAETPSSIFGALPLMLDKGYPWMVLGHEASANRGNLVWERTGEEVNHQWGKSFEAERMLDAYVRGELVSDVGVFSVLMPIHDVVIFELLRQEVDALGATHSCNVRKPWCRRCAKCAYVWLCCRAHLPREPVEALFGEDLLEVEANALHFEQMVGLGAHTPFECIGQVEESRLALALCEARGLLGPRGQALARRLPPLEVERVLERFLTVDTEHSHLPGAVAEGVVPRMRAAAASARARLVETLGRVGG
jgi:UDP-N-acetyl-alpha-D-muramoyl-L-alanyl-L-glutamate epimerase